MSGQRGYVMFLAAIVVAVLALVLLTAARVQGDMAPRARAARDEAREAIAAESLFARASWALLTGSIDTRSVMISDGAAGMGATRELRLDGRPYVAGAGVMVSVQDEAGLVNLNAPDESTLVALLEQAGFTNARTLAAALADYVDEDDLVRASGAEAREYARLGAPAPPNSALATRWQALEALGWGDAMGAERRDWLWALTTASANQGSLNINTAPRAVVEALVGESAAAAALVALREQGPLRDLGELEALTSGRLGGAGLARSPGAAFRIVIAFEEGRARRFVERRLTLSGEGDERPVFWSDERRGAGGAGQGEQIEREQLPFNLPSPAS